MPAALVPRPWDFTPAPILTIQPAPAEDPAKPSEPANSNEPANSPHSPSIELPPSRPASPPTLLPPITIHETSFDAPVANTAPPVDEASVELERKPVGSEAEDLPIVAVVPPTPTSIITTSSVETATPA